MPKHSPDIIVKFMFEQALNEVNELWKTKDYIKAREKDVNDMVDYFNNKKERGISMFDYFAKGAIKNNLILKDGKSATRSDIKKLKQNYSKYIYDSNLWKGIVSFNNNYIYENISLKTLEQKFAKEIMPKFLKYCGFKNIKNIDYAFAIHTKSKSGHIHIHFAFIETKPNYLCAKNKLVYRRRGIIDEKEKNYLKRLIALTIEREKYYTPLLTKTNIDIDDLKTFFDPNEKNFLLNNIEEIFFEENILKLGKLINDYRNLNYQNAKRVKYNSVNNSLMGREIKKLTKDIKNYLFKNPNSKLYDKQKSIQQDLKQINDFFQKLNNNSNIKEVIKNTKITDDKQMYIDNYVYNAIVNHALYTYKKVYNSVKTKSGMERITIDDLIQELAYLNDNKSKSEVETKREVLKKYFVGDTLLSKFPNKNKIERAFSKINDEMDKSAEEFSKLFQTHDRI